MTATGVVCVKPAQTARNAELITALTTRMVRKPKRRRMVVVAHLHAHGAERRGKGDHAGLKRRHAEADLQHQRQQERQRAEAEPEDKTAGHAGEEGRYAEQREVERRIGGVPGVHQIGRDEAGAAYDQRRHHGPGQEIEAQHREPEGDAGDAETGQHHADDVEALMVLGAQIFDVTGGERRCRGCRSER